jgi:hypothetical protein
VGRFNQVDTEDTMRPEPSAPGRRFNQPDAQTARPIVGNQPFGELKPDDPSWTEWVKQKGQDLLMAGGMKPYDARHFSSGITNIASFNPYVGGTLAGADLTYDLPRGNYFNAALDALGVAVPGALALKRYFRGAPTVRTAEQPPIEPGDYAAGRHPLLPPPTGGWFEGGGMAARQAREAAFRAKGLPMYPQAEPLSLRGSATGHYKAVENAPIEYHPNAMAATTNFARRVMESPNHPVPGSSAFNPATAPEAFGALDWFDKHFPFGGNRPVTPIDFEVMRQHLRGLSGANKVAGNQAIQAMEHFTLTNPPPGMVTRGTPVDLAQARVDLQAARGDWRSAETASEVQNMLRQARTYKDPIGPKIKSGLEGDTFAFATPEERAALTKAAVAEQPNWADRARTAGVTLGAAAAGGAPAHVFGLPPVASIPIGMTTGAFGGGGLNRVMQRYFGNQRATSAAEGAADLIAQNSPLYRPRVAASPDVIDPTVAMRDAITYAMMPQVTNAGKDYWDQLHVPYENREGFGDEPTARVTVRPIGSN